MLEQIYQQALEKEKAARQKAEQLLEHKANELYLSNKKLQKKNKTLKLKNQELEKALKELKQIQIQLIQSSKMASIGQLAAGVAHEINNPIGYLSNNLRVLNKYMATIKEVMQSRQRFYDEILHKLSSEDIILKKLNLMDIEKTKNIDYIIEDINNLLAESLEGVKRVADIVIGLNSFARLNRDNFKYASINECIESTLKVIWNEIKYKCDVKTEFSDIPLIKCNPGQLNQVFMNLIVNASQAIENKGAITIKTSLENSNIQVCISDNGCGIPKEDLQNIFEPFYTTKPVGFGTGLGLSISYGIIQKHGGTITVQSEVGEGTTFTIHLPTELKQEDPNIIFSSSI